MNEIKDLSRITMNQHSEFTGVETYKLLICLGYRIKKKWLLVSTGIGSIITIQIHYLILYFYLLEGETKEIKRFGKVPVNFVRDGRTDRVVSAAARRDGLQFVVDRLVRMWRRICRRWWTVTRPGKIFLVSDASQITVQGTVERDAAENIIGRHRDASFIRYGIFELLITASIVP